MRSVGEALSLVCESDRSWSAALLAGEPLGGRWGEGIVVRRFHIVGCALVVYCSYVEIICRWALYRSREDNGRWGGFEGTSGVWLLDIISKRMTG